MLIQNPESESLDQGYTFYQPNLFRFEVKETARTVSGNNIKRF